VGLGTPTGTLDADDEAVGDALGAATPCWRWFS
jgi:hypothetical protein